MMRVDSKLLVAAVCALLSGGGLGCSGADAMSQTGPSEVASSEGESVQSSTEALGLAQITNDEGEAVAFGVRLDPKPCTDAEGTCAGLYLQTEGSAEEIYVEGASFVEQNLTTIPRDLFALLARGGRVTVVGSVCRGNLERLPRKESGVVIGTAIGVPTGARRVVLDGLGNFIGTFVSGKGTHQTIRIRTIVKQDDTP